MSTAERLDQYYRFNNLDERVPNFGALVNAPDEDYFAVLKGETTRIRRHESGDARTILPAPDGMKCCVVTGRDGSTLGTYFVDSRVHFQLGVNANEILLTPPAKWSQLTRRNSGVDSFSDIKPSILVPFFPE